MDPLVSTANVGGQRKKEKKGERRKEHPRNRKCVMRRHSMIASTPSPGRDRKTNKKETPRRRRHHTRTEIQRPLGYKGEDKTVCGGRVMGKVRRTIVAHVPLKDTADGVTHLRILRWHRDIQCSIEAEVPKSRDVARPSRNSYLFPAENVGKALALLYSTPNKSGPGSGECNTATIPRVPLPESGLHQNGPINKAFVQSGAKIFKPEGSKSAHGEK